MIDVNEKITLADVEGTRNYQLTSLIIHAGKSAEYGHYYSIARNEADWFVLNDSTVTQVKQPITNFIQSLAQF